MDLLIARLSEGLTPELSSVVLRSARHHGLFLLYRLVELDAERPNPDLLRLSLLIVQGMSRSAVSFPLLRDVAPQTLERLVKRSAAEPAAAMVLGILSEFHLGAIGALTLAPPHQFFPEALACLDFGLVRPEQREATLAVVARAAAVLPGLKPAAGSTAPLLSSLARLFTLVCSSANPAQAVLAWQDFSGSAEAAAPFLAAADKIFAAALKSPRAEALDLVTVQLGVLGSRFYFEKKRAAKAVEHISEALRDRAVPRLDALRGAFQFLSRTDPVLAESDAAAYEGYVRELLSRALLPAKAAKPADARGHDEAEHKQLLERQQHEEAAMLGRVVHWGWRWAPATAALLVLECLASPAKSPAHRCKPGALAGLASASREFPLTDEQQAALGPAVSILVATEGGLLAADRALLGPALACFPFVVNPRIGAEDAVLRAAIVLALQAGDEPEKRTASQALADYVARGAGRSVPLVLDALIDHLAKVADPTVLVAAFARLDAVLAASVGLQEDLDDARTRRLERVALAWMAGSPDPAARACSRALVAERLPSSPLWAAFCGAAASLAQWDPRASPLDPVVVQRAVASVPSIARAVAEAWDLAASLFPLSPAPSSPVPVSLPFLCATVDPARNPRAAERFLKGVLASLMAPGAQGSDAGPLSEQRRPQLEALSLVPDAALGTLAVLLKTEGRELLLGAPLHREPVILAFYAECLGRHTGATWAAVEPLFAAQPTEMVLAWRAERGGLPASVRLAGLGMLERYLRVACCPFAVWQGESLEEFGARTFALLAGWWPRLAESCAAELAAGVLRCVARLFELGPCEDEAVLSQVSLLIDASILRGEELAAEARAVASALLARSTARSLPVFLALSLRDLAPSSTVYLRALQASFTPAWLLEGRVSLGRIVAFCCAQLASSSPDKRDAARRLIFSLDESAAADAAVATSSAAFPLRGGKALPKRLPGPVPPRAVTEGAVRWADSIASNHPGLAPAVLHEFASLAAEADPASLLALVRCAGRFVAVLPACFLSGEVDAVAVVAAVVGLARAARASPCADAACLSLASDVATLGEPGSGTATLHAFVDQLVALRAAQEDSVLGDLFAALNARSTRAVSRVAEAHLRSHPLAALADVVDCWAAKFCPAPPTAGEAAGIALLAAAVPECGAESPSVAAAVRHNARVLFRGTEAGAVVGACFPAECGSADLALGWALGTTDPALAVESLKEFVRLGFDAATATAERARDLGRILSLAAQDGREDLADEILASLLAVAGKQPAGATSREQKCLREIFRVGLVGLALPDARQASRCLAIAAQAVRALPAEAVQDVWATLPPGGGAAEALSRALFKLSPEELAAHALPLLLAPAGDWPLLRAALHAVALSSAEYPDHPGLVPAASLQFRGDGPASGSSEHVPAAPNDPGEFARFLAGLVKARLEDSVAARLPTFPAAVFLSLNPDPRAFSLAACLLAEAADRCGGEDAKGPNPSQARASDRPVAALHGLLEAVGLSGKSPSLVWTTGAFQALASKAMSWLRRDGPESAAASLVALLVARTPAPQPRGPEVSPELFRAIADGTVPLAPVAAASMMLHAGFNFADPEADIRFVLGALR